MKNQQNQLSHNLESSQLRRKPFDYCTIEQFFNADLYQQMLNNLPDSSHYQELAHSHCLQPDGSYARLELKLEPEAIAKLPEPQRKVWQQCYDILSSDETKAVLFKKFERALTKRFGSIDNLPIHPQIVLLRDLAGYRIGVHSDTRQKLVTVQCYMPEDDSQSHLGTSMHRRNLFKKFHLTDKMQFLPNSGYAFPVMHNSWHSVDLMKNFEKPRNSLMLNYYKSEPIPEKVRLTKVIPTVIKKFQNGNK